jgi:aspartate aminotransferase
MKIAQRLAEIAPSATLEITARAKAMKAQGIDCISLGAGEPDFDTPPVVVEAAVRALHEGMTRYTPVGGIPQLINAIAAKLKKQGLEYAPAEILVSCGAKHSLYNAFMAVLDPGDEVLIPAPAWVSYPEMARLAGARPVFVPTTEEEGFLVTPEKLAGYVTPKTRMVVINSPSNPTGAGYTAGQLRLLGDFAVERDLLIISDEIYDELVYGGFTQVSIATLDPAFKSRTIVVNGFSKTYAMTGWRLGYAAGPKDILEAMRVIQSHSTSNPTSFAQKGGIAALADAPEVVRFMVSEFEARKNYIVGRLRGIPQVTCLDPRGAFYVFPRFSAYYGRKWSKGVIGGSIDLAEYLLQEAKVAVIPGQPFEADEHVRISFACSLEDLSRAADRIEEALARLA